MKCVSPENLLPCNCQDILVVSIHTIVLYHFKHKKMNQLPILSVLAVTFLICSCSSSFNSKQSVNPVIGDISFEKKFGYKPTASTDNELRIKTHLEYAENMLRQKDVPLLSPMLIKNRNRMLDLLHKYWKNGVFPKNFDYPEERKPCFIDKDGRICAIGYLIEQTAGRKAAENINNNHKYDNLLAMNDKIINDWVSASGLTKEECAMIQPTYGWPFPPDPSQTTLVSNKISTSYGISSSIAAGLNLSLNTINGIQIGKGIKNKTVALLGLITGASQVVLGAINIPKEQTDLYGRKFINESQKTLSFINIGLGTTSMILSTWNLIANRKPKEKAISWNIYSFPAPDNSTGFAVSLVKRLGK